MKIKQVLMGALMTFGVVEGLAGGAAAQAATTTAAAAR
ncbi:alpha/beta hydrolase, partial [Burkholderia sp. Cy-647]|nr:alpha/beta hydrolase [Burkholderia sp. Cy-647]